MSTSTHRVADAIADYFSARTQGPWAVSTRHVMERVRLSLPDLVMSDEELIRLIADQAISRGFNVTFDASEAQEDR